MIHPGHSPSALPLATAERPLEPRLLDLAHNAPATKLPIAEPAIGATP